MSGTPSARTQPSPRTEIVYNVEPFRAARARGRLETHLAHADSQAVDLYNLAEDPYEKNNLAAAHPDKVAELQKRANELAAAGVKPLLLEAVFKAIQAAAAHAAGLAGGGIRVQRRGLKFKLHSPRTTKYENNTKHTHTVMRPRLGRGHRVEPPARRSRAKPARRGRAGGHECADACAVRAGLASAAPRTNSRRPKAFKFKVESMVEVISPLGHMLTTSRHRGCRRAPEQAGGQEDRRRPGLRCLLRRPELHGVDAKLGLYAQMAAPPTLDELIPVVKEKTGL